METTYYNTNGNTVALYRLVVEDPEWAVARIESMADKINQLDTELAEANYTIGKLAALNRGLIAMLDELKKGTEKA